MISNQPPRGAEEYQTVAETVGGLSLRAMDNIVQACAIIGTTIVGAIIGFFVHDAIGAVIGGVIGMVVSTVVSGVVLMILGWVRAARRKQR